MFAHLDFNLDCLTLFSTVSQPQPGRHAIRPPARQASTTCPLAKNSRENSNKANSTMPRIGKVITNSIVRMPRLGFRFECECMMG
jgi:hypothetical protein